ncbi:MAG: hypothetical protein H0W34_07295 [Pyrinomonadaceae bacterium]|nr:hypothetical protein [Pyrinomonadaceae bacterium]
MAEKLNRLSSIPNKWKILSGTGKYSLEVGVIAGAPAALLVLMRRPAIPLSGAAFVRPGDLLSGADGESPALLAASKRLNPPAQK